MGRWNPSFVAISLPLPTCLGGTEFLELHSHDLETTSLFRTYEALCLIYVHALLPTLFYLSPRILWDVLSHQQGNVWTVKTSATLNGWMKVYHMLIFFVDLTKRPMTDHMGDYSAMLVRNPLLKMWPQSFIAYYCYWGWGLSHGLSDSFAQVCHHFCLL